mmetsp:Transcript_6288/g.17926  ORF Transcript_6288/g.17926 Transcript_6288/m.17926 type:complete len:254 (-) Transcript_6288:481-1242(-)
MLGKHLQVHLADEFLDGLGVLRGLDVLLIRRQPEHREQVCKEAGDLLDADLQALVLAAKAVARNLDLHHWELILLRVEVFGRNLCAGIWQCGSQVVDHGVAHLNDHFICLCITRRLLADLGDHSPPDPLPGGILAVHKLCASTLLVGDDEGGHGDLLHQRRQPVEGLWQVNGQVNSATRPSVWGLRILRPQADELERVFEVPDHPVQAVSSEFGSTAAKVDADHGAVRRQRSALSVVCRLGAQCVTFLKLFGW